MKPNIVVLARPETAFDPETFDRIFTPIGEIVTELSLLNTILKERHVDLILVDGNFPGITRAVLRRVRMRSPLADVWKIVDSSEDRDEEELFDGIIIAAGGRTEISQKVTRVLFQKTLLKKYGLVGRSEKMKLVAETIDRIAPTDISVLIIGPSGSGKELVSRAIHHNSRRGDRRIVAVNCGALAEGVLESELFGHEKGAFTGSVGKRDGLFVQADGGSIFLDEIGETKPELQVKLLRVLEDGIFYPVGGDKPTRVDVRVIAATNRDLNEAISDGLFREDLYFRLSVVKIVLPSLYERREDILPLLCHFAEQEKLKGFSDSAIELLTRYDWPGNVRQLRNFVTRMSALHRDREISAVEVEQFIAEQGMQQKQLPVATGHTPEQAGHELIYHALLSLGSEVKMLRELILANLPARQEFEAEGDYRDGGKPPTHASIQGMERELIISMLRETGGNRKAAARKLGIGERTLYRKLKKYNLN
ncbi:MAG: sigma-54-dependent Fis family transcriptional regulator [Candidatus Zixiibacteriota bacterium]|nr:MAG: sigma-54-dependent Fis family transcriptional regulator [candidate division Zixibacteria bacterium]